VVLKVRCRGKASLGSRKGEGLKRILSKTDSKISRGDRKGAEQKQCITGNKRLFRLCGVGGRRELIKIDHPIGGRSDPDKEIKILKKGHS